MSKIDKIEQKVDRIGEVGQKIIYLFVVGCTILIVGGFAVYSILKLLF